MGEAPKPEPADMSPERALEWVDTAIDELEGALGACAPHLDAGTIDPIQVSAKINGLFMRVLNQAQAAEAAAT